MLYEKLNGKNGSISDEDFNAVLGGSEGNPVSELDSPFSDEWISVILVLLKFWWYWC